MNSQSDNFNSVSILSEDDKKLLMKLSFIIVIFLFTFASQIKTLINTWSSRDDYSHGFLIPIISLYFIWSEREKLRSIAIEPRRFLGFSLLLIGGLICLMGKVSSVIFVQQISLLIILPALILTLLGTQHLKSMALPLGYLILMIPILDVFINNIHWPFQLFSASMSAGLLSLMNVPVLQTANYLQLPNITLEVAKECSGMKYLVSIIALAIPLAYFTQRDFAMKALLVVSSFFIAIGTNILRITFIGIWSQMGGKVLHGPMHILQGLFVSVVGFIFLFILALLLNRFTSSRNDNELRKCKDYSKIKRFDVKLFNKAWIGTIFILLGIFLHQFMYTGKKVSLEYNLKDYFKNAVYKNSNYSIVNNPLFKAVNADSEITISDSSLGKHMSFYLGYFESQTQDKELDDYRLEFLYRNAKNHFIRLDENKNFTINKTIIEESGRKFLVLSGYYLNNKVVANRLKAKLITAIDGLIFGRTNGALILVYSEINDISEKDEVLQSEIDVLKKMVPLLSPLFSKAMSV